LSTLFIPFYFLTSLIGGSKWIKGDEGIDGNKRSIGEFEAD